MKTIERGMKQKSKINIRFECKTLLCFYLLYTLSTRSIFLILEMLCCYSSACPLRLERDTLEKGVQVPWEEKKQKHPLSLMQTKLLTPVFG